MNREEMVDLRSRLLMGDPPYTVDQMSNMRREKGGVRGLDELKKLGDYNPDTATLRLALETSLKLIDHLLERMRKP